MPSSITHSYFALDVLKNLPPFCQERIKEKQEYFKAFSQGSDPFMFYHFFITKKGSKLQNKIHKEKTQEFFLNTIKYIHENKLQHHQEVMSYLYGHICHYYLDINTHPFIYYKSGIFNKRKKETYPYNALHQKIEYRIDSYFIEKRENIHPKNFKIDKFIFKIDTFSKELNQLIITSIGNTYQIPNIVSLYKKSLWYMKKFFYLANYDPYGIKIKIYKLIDKLSPKFIINLEELSYYSPYSYELDYLNLKHKTWNYPWDKTKTFQSSFLDLYEIALQDACTTIKEITLMLEKKKLDEKRILKIFPNLSYSTGLDCKKKVKMKYFEF